MPYVSCKICSKAFYTKPFHLKKGWGLCCSRECQYERLRNGKKVSCSVCNKNIYRSPQELRRSKSKKYFCSKSCQTKWRNTYFSGKRHKLWNGGATTYRNLLSKSGILKICVHCGLDDERVLVVHHVDKNHRNNKLTNLAWLCHNCHLLVHHDKVEAQKFMAALV